jgi:hypothetical protein
MWGIHTTNSIGQHTWLKAITSIPGKKPQALVRQMAQTGQTETRRGTNKSAHNKKKKKVTQSY